MAKKKKFTIGVVFGTTIVREVKASDVDDARSIAELEAAEIFQKDLKSGRFRMDDFSYEAYRL